MNKRKAIRIDHAVYTKPLESVVTSEIVVTHEADWTTILASSPIGELYSNKANHFQTYTIIGKYNYLYIVT